MFTPYLVGLDQYRNRQIPSVSLDIEVYEDWKDYRVKSAIVNSKPLTTYFRGVKDLGLLGRLLLSSDVREVLCHWKWGISIHMNGAECLPDRGANLVGYALLKQLANTSMTDTTTLFWRYRDFLGDNGYERGNPNEQISDQTQHLSLSAEDLYRVMRFAHKNSSWASQELSIQPQPRDEGMGLVFTFTRTCEGSWSAISIHISNDTPLWTEPARLDLFASDAFTELCMTEGALPKIGDLFLHFSPNQGLLRISADTWHMDIPTLIFSALPPTTEPISTDHVLNLYQQALREQMEEWTGRSSTSRLANSARPVPIPSSRENSDTQQGETQSIPAVQDNANRPDIRKSVLQNTQTTKPETERVGMTLFELDDSSEPDELNPRGEEVKLLAAIQATSIEDTAPTQHEQQQDRFDFDAIVDQRMAWGMERLAEILSLRENLIPEKEQSMTAIFDRDPNVVAYVRLRSDGQCELCGWRGFEKNDGSRYIEIHHVVPLSEGGEDTPRNTAALCPNCHRAIHYSAQRQVLIENLVQLLKSKGISVG